MDEEMTTFRVLHLFGGLGGGALGFQAARSVWRGISGRFATVCGVDSDPEACRDFEALSGARAVEADIATMTAEELRAAAGVTAPDVVFMSPPCLPSEGRVLTDKGPRRIASMRAGELVLTHWGRFQRVLKVGHHVYEGPMFGVRLNGTVDVQEFTAEHPLWRRKVVRRGRDHKRQLGEPEFVQADRLRVGDRVGFPVQWEDVSASRRFVSQFGDPRKIVKGGKGSGRYAKPKHDAESPRTIDLRQHCDSYDLWFLFGAYLGDGYRVTADNEVNFCVGAAQGDLAMRVRASLQSLGIGWAEDRNGGESNIKIRVSARHLCMLCGEFGDGAQNKHVPQDLMGLPKVQIEALLAGYRAADGSEQGRRVARNTLQARWKVPSVSLQLLRDFQRLLLRLEIFASIHKCWPGGPQTIMGRVVNTLPRWELSVRFDPRKRTVFEFADGAVWVRVRSIEKRVAAEPVWNLEVAEDNTFCVPMMATHNCKGFSGLLPAERARSEHYQRLNRLVLQGLFLVLETWPTAPRLILVENVPRITSRGAELLLQVKQVLGRYGYRFHEGFHDCGELGGLAQHRRRYLLLARHEEQLPTFVYQPPARRVRAIGEVLGELPLPGDPAAGPLHRLPRLQWRTWVRLALIPAGGDWRDLPAGEYAVTGDPSRFKGRPGLMRVAPWDQPIAAVTGSAAVAGSNGTAAVADPRRRPFNNVWRVVRWDETAGAVTAGSGPSSSGVCVADPRLSHAPQRGAFRVVPWGDASPLVDGSAGIGHGNAFAVADPRLGCSPRAGAYRVVPWGEASPAVIGSADVHAGAAAVADPRLPSETDRPDPPPVIIALDGTWHRPLTTLELAALQGLPVALPGGQRLELAGRADGRWRERIGNAVPPPAAQAIAEALLAALLPASAGTGMVLGSTAIWVEPHMVEVQP